MNEENKKIKLGFDIVPVTEGVIAFDTLYGYDNIRVDYVANYEDFENNKEKILNIIVDKVLYSFDINEEIKSQCGKADIILILDRETRRVLKIINNNYIKKDELKKFKNIEDMDYLQYRLEKLLGE
jgi:hypothetical protein